MDRFPPGSRSLPHLLEWRAGHSADTVWLVVDSVETHTFAAMFERAARVARRLRATTGARPAVGIMMRSGSVLVEALHGTLMAGGTAFLIDPSWPLGTLRAALGGSRLDVLVVGTSTVAAGHDPPAPASVLSVADTVLLAGSDGGPDGGPDGDVRAWDRWLEGPGLAGPLGPVHEGDDAIVMFTSGTTGVPKGVVCSHAFAYNYSAFVTDSLGRGPRTVLSTPLPLVHASGLHMVVHSALHAGCPAHVKTGFSARRFWEQVAAEGATQANLVAEMARMVERAGTPVAGHRLRYLVAGGFHDHEAFEERFSTRVLSQAYGMTEIYISPMCDSPWAPGDDVLGLPLGCFDYAAVDEDDRPLPQGEVGELVLSPNVPGVAFTRYHNDPTATAQAWRGGMFHTADLVEIDGHGVVHFRGRTGGRIRRRGENVSAGEIEEAAMGFSGVERAAAYAVPGDLGDDEIKLDVEASCPLDLEALHAHLANVLRRAAVPRYLEQLATLPTTATFRPAYAVLRDAGTDRPAVLDTAGSAR
ncbi:MAG: AMP-binding protein [Acidimicrobiales bacterium]